MYFICACVDNGLDVHIYLFICLFTRIHVNIKRQNITAEAATRISMYICIRTHTHTHTHLNTHTQANFNGSDLYGKLHICLHTHTPTRAHSYTHKHYGVATVSRIDKIIGLFCRISSLL